MEGRIQTEKGSRSPAEVSELILDNCRSASIEGLTDDFVNLKKLAMIGVGLLDLKGFPKLPNLVKLELADNKISNGLEVLEVCENLSALNLSNNRIQDLETLEPLKGLKQLKSLDLFENGVTKLENYREKVFDLLPQVEFLDTTDRDGKDAVKSSDEEDAEEEDEEEDDDDNVIVNDDDDAEDEDDLDEVNPMHGPGLKALYAADLKDTEDSDDADYSEEGDEDEGDVSEEYEDSEEEDDVTMEEEDDIEADERKSTGEAEQKTEKGKVTSPEDQGVKRKHEEEEKDGQNDQKR